ncbi:magnesium transporter [candidate division KSB1 bacterium]|nr:magnesium transporter [candidate division KSB1 bacterium]
MIERLLQPEIDELIEKRDLGTLQEVISEWFPAEIADLIESLPPEIDVVVFRLLARDLAADVFEYLSLQKQEQLLHSLAKDHKLLTDLMNDLSPDDRTALFEELPGTVTQQLLRLLTPEEHNVAVTLLGYPEDSVGRLMTPDYVAVRSEWDIAKSLMHIRRYGKDSETLNVVYVVDHRNHLLDDLRIREILLAEPDTKIADLMDRHFITLKATDDRETAVQIFHDYSRFALPVTDSSGILVGIVTIDDVLVVAQEEATEDMQKIGGVDPLEYPYFDTSFLALIKKRGLWLILLFLGEMITASAMGYFEDEIARVVVLALFIPLIISSGGNSGSQAATLVIRALAVGEFTLRDWWPVMKRELLSGMTLGCMLGLIGVLRVAAWQWLFQVYGEHWLMLALTVGFSLTGVVLLGVLAGSMLPFLLKKLGADPAVSSAPFIATFVDVTGLVIYFTIAAMLLSGALL